MKKKLLPAQQLSLATTPGSDLGANLRVVLDGELMTNYQAVLPVAPGHRIAAAQDRSGNPMLFSIGGDGHLYLIGQAPGTASGWQQIDLSACLGDALYGLTFGLAQASDGSLSLGLALAPSSSDTSSSTLYLATGLPNDTQDPAWQGMASRWVARPAQVGAAGATTQNLGAPPISRILIGDVLDAGSPALVIVVAQVGGEAQHYFVNGDTSSSAWQWQDYPLPLDAATVLDLAIGFTPLGVGTYALCRDPSGTQTSLTFTSVPNAYGQTYNRQFQAPSGARCLAAIPDPNDYGYSQLFVGGDGLWWFPSAGQAANASAQVILASSPGGSIVEMQVRENSQQIVIWWFDRSENLYLVQGRQSNRASGPGWSEPLVLRGQVTQIAAYCSQPRQTSAIFYVTGAAALGFMIQAEASTLWTDMPIPLSDTGEVDSFVCYTSQLQLLSEQGMPLAGQQVAISASQLSYTTINGNLYVLDGTQPITVTTDPTGSITCINRVTSLATPIYTVSAEFLSAPIVLNPASKVIAGLAAIQTGSDLRGATKQDGSPLITGDYPDEVYDYGAYSIAQLNTMIAALPTNGAPSSTSSASASKAKVVPAATSWGMTFESGRPRLYTGAAVGRELLPALGGRAQPRMDTELLDLGVVDWVEGVFGDVMQAIETGIEKVVGFVVSAAEQVFEFIVKIGAKVFRVVIECVAQALELACWILDALFGLDLLAFLQWLGFLFDWGDILTTHDVIGNMANQSLNLVVAELGRAKLAIVGFFDQLEQRLGQAPTLPSSIAALTVGDVVAQTKADTSPENQSSAQFMTSGVVSNFGTYQTQFSGMLSATATGAGSGSGPIVTFFEDVLVPTMKQAAGLLETFLGDLVKVVQGVKAGTMTIGEAIELIVGDTLLGLLDIAETLALGLIDVAQSLIELLQSLLGASIDIPFLTALYRLVTKGDAMTLLDGLALLAAIPSTIFYKIVTDEAPFDEQAFGLASGGYQQVFATLGLELPAANLQLAASSGGGGNFDAQVVYSTLGGAAALGAKLLSVILDSINALAKSEVKFTSELQLISSLVQIATTFPIASDNPTITNLAYGDWAVGIMDLLVGFCGYVTPRSASVEMQTFVEGPYILLSTTVHLALAIAALVILCQEDRDEALAWDVEAFVESLCDAVAGYASGIAKIDPDPVTQSIEEGVAILVTALGVLLGAIRDIDDMIDREVFVPA